MKNEDLFDAIGQMDETLLKDAEAKKNGRRWAGWIAGAVAACLCLGIGGHFLFGNKEETRWPRKTIYYSDITLEAGIQETVQDILMLEPWEEMDVLNQYPAVMVEGKEYSTRRREVKVMPEELGASLGTAECVGYSIMEDERHTMTANLYEIHGISTDCALAVELLPGEYYVCVYSWYQPETLGDFVEDLNLREHLSVGDVHYSYFDDSTHVQVELYGLTEEMVWTMLLDDLSVEAIDDYDQRWFEQELSFSVSLPILGYENVGMAITKDGYLTTNLLDTGKAFYLGTEKTEAFRDYLFEHLEGQETVFVYDTPQEDNDPEEPITAVEEYTTQVYSADYEPEEDATQVSPGPVEEYTNEDGAYYTRAYDPNK